MNLLFLFFSHFKEELVDMLLIFNNELLLL